MASAERPLRRILVALDASAHGRAALEAAARLAARSHAELVGLYVEDVALLRLAAFPFAREFSVGRTTGRALTAAAMARALRSQARHVREFLVRTAERHHVAWTFAVRRGEVDRELLAAVADADLLVLGRTRGAATRRPGLGSTVRAVVGRCSAAVLVVPGGTRPGGAVVALYDDEGSGGAAVAMGAALARADDGELVVLVSDEALRPAAEAAVAASAARGRLRVVAPADLAAALADLARSGNATVVLHRAAWNDAVLEQATGPVVVVG